MKENLPFRRAECKSGLLELPRQGKQKKEIQGFRRTGPARDVPGQENEG